MRLAPVAAAALLASAAAASAEPIIFSGYVEGRLGYGTNPFLRTQTGLGAGIGGFSLAPTLTRTTSQASTTLSGVYDRDQYFRTYGHTQTVTVDLRHVAQVRSNLSITLQASYGRTNNPLISSILDPGLFDNLTIGQETQRISGEAQVQWQATKNDAINYGINYEHSSFSRSSFAGGFDLLGANFGYLRTLGPRTKLGVRVSASRYESDINPGSHSVQPALALQQTLSPIWKFDGDIGVIFQNVSGPAGGSSKGLGFHASLCGTYPRVNVCLTGQRQTTASGFGGLRTTTEASLTVITKLSERSTITGEASYDLSNSQRLALLREAEVFQARLDYQRDLTQRLSAGVTGRYQSRDLGGIGAAHAVSGTVNVRVKIGRLK